MRLGYGVPGLVADRSALGIGECELAAVVVEVLSSVVVDVLETHRVLEERVPAGREVHPTLKGDLGLGLEVAL